jgi:very-short-patch-repair endonuclease
MKQKNIEEWLKEHAGLFDPVVPFKNSDKLLMMDFTAANTELTEAILADTNLFIQYINRKLDSACATYGIGGYNEHRTVYSRSKLFGPSPAAGTTVAGTAKASASGGWEGKEDLSSVEEETVGYRYADPTFYGMLQEYVLKHRNAPTEAEAILWEALKTKQLKNYKFRRQHIIDKYIADFVCLKKKLVVEVDGLIHQLPENKESDEQRTARLNSAGFRVIRFTNSDVINNPEKVLHAILTALENESEAILHPGLSSPTGGQGAEPRRLHLGIDIWGKPYTRVMAPLDGIVHSFAFNNAYGDYGATIILTHNLEGSTFYTLYGHLSLNSIKNMQEGDVVRKGDVFCEFGIPFENGQWPPHLHFQIIRDMQGMKGDYPGVCRFSERESYLANCPDADLILKMMTFALKD